MLYFSLYNFFYTKLLVLYVTEAKLIQKIRSRRPPGHWFKLIQLNYDLKGYDGSLLSESCFRVLHEITKILKVKYDGSFVIIKEVTTEVSLLKMNKEQILNPPLHQNCPGSSKSHRYYKNISSSPFQKYLTIKYLTINY